MSDWGKGTAVRHCLSCKRNKVGQNSKSGLCGSCWRGPFQKSQSILRGLLKK